MIRGPAARVRGAPAKVLVIAAISTAAGFAGRPARAADLFVGSTRDVVNGDTSSPAALASNPGPDGISLREALLAAASEPGPHRVEIDRALSGSSIVLASDLPPILRDGISLVGPTDAAGQPLVTISGSPISVFASRFRMSGLRLAGVRGAAVFVFAGSPDFPTSGTIADVRIENDVFDGTDAAGAGHGIAIGTAADSALASFRRVTISGNTFLGFRGDDAAILCEAGGTAGEIRGVSVAKNTFSRNSIAIRAGVVGRGDRLSALAIAANEFRDNAIAVAVISGALSGSPPSVEGVVEGLRIEGNRIRQGENSAIYFLAGGGEATRLVIRDVEIVNNVIWGGSGFAIGGEAGSGSGATNNRIEGIRVVNDTIAVAGTRSGLAFYRDSYGAEGNSVTGIEVLNSIFAGDGVDFAGDEKPDSVSHSIVGDPPYAGTEGNFSAPPGFVDAAGGDFHLLPGSAAIGKGRISGAPCRDLEGRARFADGAVDIGAYEFGAPVLLRPCPIIAPDRAGPGTSLSR